MKLILDTNTVLSAIFKPENRQAAMLNLWRAGHFEWLTCTQQLEEFADVLARPRIFPRIVGGSATAQQLIEEMHVGCTFFSLLPSYPAVCRDAKDDYLIALMVRGSASYLVTGDKDLLVLKNQFSIVSVPEFLDRL